MTRRDFVTIAQAMFRSKPLTVHTQAMQAWKGSVLALSDALRCNNPAFDRSRFESACGLTN
jgi:hypothetical protein